jgi:hypothetical protein
MLAIVTNKEKLSHDSVRGRPHYYSTKKAEYAHIRFDLDAGASLFLPSSSFLFLPIPYYPLANSI